MFHLDNNQDHSHAWAVSIMAGLYSLVADGGKVITAFFVALATGAGYKMGTWAFVALKDWLASRARLKAQDKETK